MKKSAEPKKNILNIVLWIIVSVLVFVLLYSVYHRLTAAGKLNKLPPNGNMQQSQDKDAGNKDTTKETTPDTNTGENSNNADKEQTGKGTEKDEKVYAPDFTLNDLNGKPVKLSDYKGKIVLLNFWGTWCKYCVDEMPDLNEAHKEISKNGEAVILAVNDTSTEKPGDAGVKAVKDFAKQYKLSMPVVLDMDGSITAKYGVSGYPTTFVIDKDGSIYGYQSGALTKKIIVDVVNQLK